MARGAVSVILALASHAPDLSFEYRARKRPCRLCSQKYDCFQSKLSRVLSLVLHINNKPLLISVSSVVHVRATKEKHCLTDIASTGARDGFLTSIIRFKTDRIFFLLDLCDFT